MITLKDVFHERLEQFRADYTFPEQDEAIRALAVTGELLSLMFQGNEAALAMTALRKIIGHGPNRAWKWAALDEVELDQNWRETWDHIDGWNDSSSPPFLDELHELNAFGNFGIFPTWAFAGKSDLAKDEAAELRNRLLALKDAQAWVAGVCAKIDLLEQIAPRDSDGKTLLDCLLQTRDRARARMKLDLGGSLTIADVALLSGVSIKRVQNAIYAKTDEAPILDKAGQASPDSCEVWLSSRDYMPSIWKQVSQLYPLDAAWGESIPFEDAEQEKIISDFIFVPVATDGTMFTPDLRRTRAMHFVIGAKGNERTIGNYEEALAELYKMDVPRWRRPNPQSGNLGIVTGQTWKRVRKSELGL